jgi:hypothetical protein
MDKKYRVIVIIGSRKNGKSYFIKNSIIPKYRGPKFIFDINNEYPGLGSVMPMEDFLDQAIKKKGHLIIFEEATVFFSNKGDEKRLKHLMVLARHAPNTVIFVFHSIQSMPSYILTQTDLIVLFRTVENIALVRNKIGENVDIWRAFVEINNNSKKYDKRFISLRE